MQCGAESIPVMQWPSWRACGCSAFGFDGERLLLMHHAPCGVSGGGVQPWLEAGVAATADGRVVHCVGSSALLTATQRGEWMLEAGRALLVQPVCCAVTRPSNT